MSKNKNVLFMFALSCGLGGLLPIHAQEVSQNRDLAYVSNAKSSAVAALQQQKKKVQGRVVDGAGEPIIGATVMAKGSTNGTVTDLDGNFTLGGVADNATLTISFLGYKTQSVAVGGKSNIVVTLSEDVATLNEVVAIGFGSQKKANLTGSVAAVTGKDIATRPVANSAVLLQGVIPGLRVNQSLGQPGNESVSFRLRGQGTFSSAGSDPLILINGVPGSLENLDPNTIEGVSVLKDAASAAIYGARAANGVILVTTKAGSGVMDKVAITYNGNVGFHSPTRMYDLVNDSPNYMKYANMAWANSNSGKAYTEEMMSKYRTPSAQYPSFDWLGYMFNTATVWNHNLSVAGTGSRTTYNVSLNYVSQPGTMRGFKYDKYNATVDVTTKINNFIKVGTYTNLMMGDSSSPRQGQEDAFLSTLSQAPTYMPWLPEDGTGARRYTNAAYNIEEHNKNMAAIMDAGVKRTQRNFDLNSQIWVQVDLLKGLSWYTKGAVRLLDTKQKVFVSGVFPIYDYHTGVANGSLDTGTQGLSVDDGRRFYKNLYSYLKYDFALNNNAHRFSAMLGYNREDEKYETLGAYRKEYAFPLPVIDAGSTANWSNSGGEENWGIQSFFGRFNYNFKDRYLFEADARYDGTSRIAQDNRWGFFPSFSAAWRATEEKFVKDLNWGWLDDFKLRASWGQLGNQNIGLYPYQAMIASVSDYPFTKTADGTVVGYIQTAYANSDIKWETTTITDIGFDLVAFRGLSVTFDWYNKTTSDILRSSQVSGLLGLSAPTVNMGKVRNTGFELSMTYNNVVKGGFFQGLRYNIGGNIVRNRNKLVTFGAKEISGYHVYEEGLPYGQYYMLDCIGVFADKNEVDKSPKQFNDNTQPGDLKYRDANGDNVINNDDRVMIDGQFPAFEYAITGSAAWKGFDLSFITQGVANKKYYTDLWGVRPFFQGSAPTWEYINNMWTEENPNGAKYPRLYWSNMGGSKNTRSSTFYLRNASFFRLKNITLGYTLPKELTRKAKIERLRFYMSCDNILTLTGYKGLDPERGGDGRDAQYPQNKIVSFGVNVEF
uniref:TonB-dependent receptor n=2 Tax=unclassified Prevotella TaxID=2638335 RepID=A0AB33JAC4_9BACT